MIILFLFFTQVAAPIISLCATTEPVSHWRMFVICVMTAVISVMNTQIDVSCDMRNDCGDLSDEYPDICKLVP